MRAAAMLLEADAARCGACAKAASTSPWMPELDQQLLGLARWRGVRRADASRQSATAGSGRSDRDRAARRPPDIARRRDHHPPLAHE